jgi:hypothetical protein
MEIPAHAALRFTKGAFFLIQAACFDGKKRPLWGG